MASGSKSCILPLPARNNKGQVVDFVLGEFSDMPCNMDVVRDTFYFNPKGHFLHRASKKCVELVDDTLRLGNKCDQTFRFIRRF